jgi:hypothetical protein
LKGLRAKIPAIDKEAVKNRVAQLVGKVLEQLETRDAAPVEGYHFAIQQKGLMGENAHCFGDPAEVRCSILRVARKQCHMAPFFVREDAITVVFFFVDPAGLVEWLLDERREHGLNSNWNACAHPWAISASERLVRTDRGSSMRMSSLEA